MTEQRFRGLVASQPHLGEWAEWAPIAYNSVPVLPRQVMAHLYGLHDDTDRPYAYCLLCAYFRTDDQELEVNFT